MMPQNLSQNIQKQNETLKLMESLNCFSFGKIISIQQGEENKKTKILQVEIGYKKRSYSQIGQPVIINCIALQRKHYKTFYKIGDKVAIAFTDKPQFNYIANDITEIHNINNYCLTHHIANGVILFNCECFDGNSNKDLEITIDEEEANINIKNKTSSVILSKDIDLKNEKSQITISDQITIKNQMSSIVEIFKTALSAYIKASQVITPIGPFNVDDSAGKSAFEAEIDKLFK